jgi:hypothetical protein
MLHRTSGIDFGVGVAPPCAFEEGCLLELTLINPATMNRLRSALKIPEKMQTQEILSIKLIILNV